MAKLLQLSVVWRLAQLAGEASTVSSVTNRRPTLAQVAKAAGVTPGTASLVLNQRPGTRITPATAERVRAAAAELGYHPDPTARSLRTGKSRTIGFISDEVATTRFASALIRGAIDVAEKSNNLVLINECSFDPKRLDAAVSALVSRRVDGLVFALMKSRHVTVPRLPASLKAVIANGTATVAGTDWQLPAVLPDETVSGASAAEYLLARGHRRIALVGRDEAACDSEVSVCISVRMASIDAALAAAGVELALEVPGSVWEPPLGAQAFAAIRDFNRAHADAPITAVIAGNDRIAFGLFQAAAHAGVRIPEELSVISFDDEVLASYLDPGLTTMALPYLEMGRRAAQLVLEPTELRGVKRVHTGAAAHARMFPGPVGEAFVVDMPLVERASVSAPRG